MKPISWFLLEYGLPLIVFTAVGLYILDIVRREYECTKRPTPEPQLGDCWIEAQKKGPPLKVCVESAKRLFDEGGNLSGPQ